MKKLSLFLLTMCCVWVASPVVALPDTRHNAPASATAIHPPSMTAFNGQMTLAVDATDIEHQVFSVHQTIPVQQPGELVLLYPQWETGSHAPTASVAELAGLVVKIDGKRTEWKRDPADMHAFHVDVPKGATWITLDFQFLSSTRAALLRPQMVAVPWQRVLLYPAGWSVRDLPIGASLILPKGLHPFTSLAYQRESNDALAFAPVTLERLVDAPVYAGRYVRQLPLTPHGTTPIRLDVLADAPEDLAITAAELGHMKSLVSQTLKTFGAGPFRHYAMVVSLSDLLSPGGGIEHREEGENNLPAAYFRHTEEQLNNRDLIAHELVHAWNGRWRVPADLDAPTFNQPVSGSLLWVYEGQTEFWGRVLAARSGLRSPQQALDKLALDAAVVANRPGRRWKTLEDSTNDAVYMAGHHVAWRSWQRREDYYPEGVLLWLDVDARLRELTEGRRSLDDFTRDFFKAKGDPDIISTYTFDDVCAGLSTVASHDWAAFLQQHLRSHDTAVVLAGLARAGWQLTYSDVATETFLQDEAEGGSTNLDDSIGLRVDPKGNVEAVQWDGPAFRAGLSNETRVVAVNHQPFSTKILLEAVRHSATQPLHLRISNLGGERDVNVAYQGGLRYPHLSRIPGTPDRLSALLRAR